MQTQPTRCPIIQQKQASTRSARALCLWLMLGMSVALALQGCNGLSSDNSQFHTVPGTSINGSPLAINTSNHFPGHIAFVRNHRLYILNGADGSISAVPAAGSDVQDPAYSPDGSRLAYIRRSASWSDLMLIPSTGAQPTALTHNQGTGQQVTCDNGVSEADTAWAANPIWTPDGSTLYYLSDAQKRLKDSCGFLDMAVWSIPARGGTPTLALWPARGDDNTGLPGAGGDADLGLRPGSANELTYTRYAYDPTGDNTRLVQLFLATLTPAQESVPAAQQETALTPATAADGSPQQALEASWSPNGQWLAYILRANGSGSLAAMRVSDPANSVPNFHDFANTTILTSGLDSYPIWSPDGKSLLYLEFKNNEYNLYLSQLAFSGTTVSLQGSTIQLTQGGIDGDSRPTWTAV